MNAFSTSCESKIDKLFTKCLSIAFTCISFCSILSLCRDLSFKCLNVTYIFQRISDKKNELRRAIQFEQKKNEKEKKPREKNLCRKNKVSSCSGGDAPLLRLALHVKTKEENSEKWENDFWCALNVSFIRTRLLFSLLSLFLFEFSRSWIDSIWQLYGMLKLHADKRNKKTKNIGKRCSRFVRRARARDHFGDRDWNN